MAFPSKLLNEGEHVVVSTRTHVKALIVPGLVLVLVAGLRYVNGASASGAAKPLMCSWAAA